MQSITAAVTFLSAALGLADYRCKPCVGALFSFILRLCAGAEDATRGCPAVVFSRSLLSVKGMWYCVRVSGYFFRYDVSFHLLKSILGRTSYWAQLILGFTTGSTLRSALY